MNFFFWRWLHYIYLPFHISVFSFLTPPSCRNRHILNRMTLHKPCWILLGFFALVFLIINPCTAANTDNTHLDHELCTITPDTTGLTISDPNVIDHVIYYQPREHEYPAFLIVGKMQHQQR